MSHKVNNTTVKNFIHAYNKEDKNAQKYYFVLCRGVLTPEPILDALKRHNGLRTGKTITDIGSIVDEIPYEDVGTLWERVTGHLCEHKDRLVYITDDAFEIEKYKRIYGWNEVLDRVEYCLLILIEPDKQYILTDFEGEEDLLCIDELKPFGNELNVFSL